MADSFKTRAAAGVYGEVMTTQPPSSAGPRASAGRFAAIGVAPADLGRSLAFYRALGLDIPAGADFQPHVDVELAGGLRLMWDHPDTLRSIDPEWQPGTGQAQVGLAFECDSPADVDSLYAELTEAGYEGHLPPWDAPWGQRYSALRDPDGNGVDLFAPLPVTPPAQ